ncbi:MAG TPA: VWA domain-containing protein [Candidatus Nanoarchaeia archaeon]|nr:VWA domain-containing protein [Candidatus Nanoarchaeia archaeon]
MAFDLGALTLANELGWYGLLSLIPFVIIYLIRPRPVKLEIPSLMFFLTARDNPKQQSFLRNFAKDWLFIIQLLIFLLFVGQLLEPFSSYEHDITSENTVIVLDVSASMQSRRDDAKSRFTYAKQLAIDNLGKANTLVLAGGTPKVLFKDGSYDDAVEGLNGLGPTDSLSAIGESVVLAGELLGGKEGRVIVLSDFLNTRGVEPAAAKTAVESKGVVVDYIDVSARKKPSNVGIIDLDIDEQSVTVFVRNFDEEPNKATLRIGSLEKDLDFEPESTQTFSFQTPEESVQVQLVVDDDFDADNRAFIAVPSHREVRVAVISSNESVFIANAIGSGRGITVEVKEPPLIPTSGYDVYVFSQVDPSQVLPGTFEALEDEVKKGASVVIVAQDDIEAVQYKNLLPIDIFGRGLSAPINVDQQTRFTSNLEFGSVDRHINAMPKPGAISLASVGENTTMLAYQELGEGNLVYVGIIESASHFKLSPSYPIFWVKLMQYLSDQENIESLNHLTGETKVLDEVIVIKTPSRTTRQNVILFEEAGFYEFAGKQHAANLLDQAESTLAPRELNTTISREVKLKPVTEEREFSFVIPLLIAVCVFIFLELLYVKVRGDL